MNTSSPEHATGIQPTDARAMDTSEEGWSGYPREGIRRGDPQSTRAIARESVALHRAAEAVARELFPGIRNWGNQDLCLTIARAAIRAFLGSVDPEANLVVAREKTGERQ